MFMRRARAYSSFCSQVILVHLYSFCRNPLFCSQQSQNLLKKLYFRGSRSFKVIDIITIKKRVTSACYDKQHICAYPQPFSR